MNQILNSLNWNEITYLVGRTPTTCHRLCGDACDVDGIVCCSACERQHKRYELDDLTWKDGTV